MGAVGPRVQGRVDGLGLRLCGLGTSCVKEIHDALFKHLEYGLPSGI